MQLSRQTMQSPKRLKRLSLETGHADEVGFLVPTIRQLPVCGQLTPASAKRLVKLDHAQQLVETNLRQTELGLEQVPIGVERIELRVDTASITQVRQALPIL